MSWLKKLFGGRKESATAPPDFDAPLPSGMNKDNWRDYVELPTIALQVGGFRPTDNLTTTVFGDVRVSHSNENWPYFKGKALWPLCQFNLEEASDVPKGLSDLKLISIYIDPEIVGHAPSTINAKNPSPETALVIRAYSSLEELEPIVSVGHSSKLKAFECRWLEPCADYPNHDNMPIDFDALGIGDFCDQENVEPLQATKLGGWPGTIQSEPSWVFGEDDRSFEFVIQIESEPKALWGIADGAIYLARSKNDPDMWAIDIQFM